MNVIVLIITLVTSPYRWLTVICYLIWSHYTTPSIHSSSNNSDPLKCPCYSDNRSENSPSLKFSGSSMSDANGSLIGSMPLCAPR